MILSIPKKEAKDGLSKQKERGEEILQLLSADQDKYRDAQFQYRNWNDENKELIKKIYSDYVYVLKEYNNLPDFNPEYFNSQKKRVDEFGKIIVEKMAFMQTYIDQIEKSSTQSSSGEIDEKVIIENAHINEKDIFIVHGSDTGSRESVARFIEHLGLKPLILIEEVSSGKTISQDFEELAARAGFAICIFTPDDEGRQISGSNKNKPRARQNVILETGYFWGKLGLDRVRILYKEGVELPSDLHGIRYIELDDKKAWESQLEKTIKTAIEI